MEKVLKLQGVEYKWKEGIRKDIKEIGLVAQDVEKIVPEVVREQQRAGKDDTLYKQVDYEHLVPLLIESIKDLQEQIIECKKCKCNGGTN